MVRGALPEPSLPWLPHLCSPGSSSPMASHLTIPTLFGEMWGCTSQLGGGGLAREEERLPDCEPWRFSPSAL